MTICHLYNLVKNMEIRRAELKDINRILELLTDILEMHAKMRPDIFVSGTTKYRREDLGHNTGILGCSTAEMKVSTICKEKYH